MINSQCSFKLKIYVSTQDITRREREQLVSRFLVEQLDFEWNRGNNSHVHIEVYSDTWTPRTPIINNQIWNPDTRTLCQVRCLRACWPRFNPYAKNKDVLLKLTVTVLCSTFNYLLFELTL